MLSSYVADVVELENSEEAENEFIDDTTDGDIETESELISVTDPLITV